MCIITWGQKKTLTKDFLNYNISLWVQAVGFDTFGTAVWGVIGVVRPFSDAFTIECSKKENKQTIIKDSIYPLRCESEPHGIMLSFFGLYRT